MSDTILNLPRREFLAGLAAPGAGMIAPAAGGADPVDVGRERVAAAGYEGTWH